MKYLILLILFINSALGNVDYLPEQRHYRPGIDTGYTQYGTPSLHKTSKYILTFDDGPHPTNTQKILKILKKYQVKATFFIVTSKVNKSNMHILKQILDEGHIIGSHHHDHDHNNAVSSVSFKTKLKASIKTILKIYQAAGKRLEKLYYRFPYAEYGNGKGYHHLNIVRSVSQELFQNNCIRFVFWDNDSSDWVPGLSSSEVFQNLRAFQEGGKYISYKVARVNGRKKILKKYLNIENPNIGGVILQHDIQNRTVEATQLFLDYASKSYIDIIPLSQTAEYKDFSKACVKEFNRK